MPKVALTGSQAVIPSLTQGKTDLQPGYCMRVARVNIRVAGLI